MSPFVCTSDATLTKKSFYSAASTLIFGVAYYFAKQDNKKRAKEKKLEIAKLEKEIAEINKEITQ